jgi:hypothetical protein
MRYYEITEDKPVKPLTPKQARRRATRVEKAQAQLADTQATTTIKINAAKKKLSEV